MKALRLILAISILVAISAVGLGVYYYHTSQQRIASIKAIQVDEYHRSVATKPITDSGDSQSVTDIYLEHSNPDAGVLYSVTTPSATEDEFDDAEEYCCPESDTSETDNTLENESNDTSRPPTRAEIRARLVKVHGDIPEVDRFMDMSARKARREILSQDESLEYFRLMAFFLPSEQNINAYNYMKQLHAVADPDSYRMGYGD